MTGNAVKNDCHLDSNHRKIESAVVGMHLVCVQCFTKKSALGRLNVGPVFARVELFSVF